MKKSVKLSLPYVKQGKKSANCGPCSLKMIADYYGVKKPTGKRYSVTSLNRLCNVTREFGCEKSDMNRVLKKLGLKREKVNLRTMKRHLVQRRPVLSLIIDEGGVGHYAVIKGFQKTKSQEKVIFNDSYWGRDYKRPKTDFSKRARYFNNWLWAITKDHDFTGDRKF